MRGSLTSTVPRVFTVAGYCAVEPELRTYLLARVRTPETGNTGVFPCHNWSFRLQGKSFLVLDSARPSGLGHRYNCRLMLTQQDRCAGRNKGRVVRKA